MRKYLILIAVLLLSLLIYNIYDVKISEEPKDTPTKTTLGKYNAVHKVKNISLEEPPRCVVKTTLNIIRVEELVLKAEIPTSEVRLVEDVDKKKGFVRRIESTAIG